MSRRRWSRCSTRCTIPTSPATASGPSEVGAADHHAGARRDHLARRGPHRPPAAQPRRCEPSHQRLPARRRRTRGGRRWRSSSTAARSTGCPSQSPTARSSSIRRASRACTCASGRSPAAASAGPTGRRISAPRCWASSRRSRSRTRSSCRSAPRARSCPKLTPKGATREQSQAEGIACYTIFISSLLDVTDNLNGDVVMPPPDVRRRDGDDPYLVVAADKGTATFSDTANAIALDPRLLARRCLRLGRLGRLRPQEDGHHRARRLGGGEAALPRARPRHPERAVHRGRRRRHVGRRVRQRHAALAADPADRGLRPPRHLHRSRTPIRRRATPSGTRLFALPRSSWQDYDKTKLSRGGGIYLARREVGAAVGRGAHGARPQRRAS